MSVWKRANTLHDARAKHLESCDLKEVVIDEVVELRMLQTKRTNFG